MEIELERKLILLENSVRDMDERLAELYRDTAGLALGKPALLQDIAKNVNATKRHAEGVKRLHSELKTELGTVSEKLARMDSVIMQLDSLRKSARTEKVREVADLASSVLSLNRRVSKLGSEIETLKSESDDPRLGVLYRELESIRSEMRKGGNVPQLGPVVSRLDALENEVRAKAASEELETGLNEIKAVIAKMGEKAVLPSDVEALRKEFLKSLDDLDMKIKCEFDDKLEGRLASLPAKAPVVQQVLDLSEVESVGRKVDTVRERANSILKEIYDAMDSLKVANADLKNRFNALDRKVSSMPKVSAEGNVDLSGVLSTIEELRDNIGTLSKGIEISRVIAEELKKTQSELSKLEQWKSRNEEAPRELERLAERLAVLESARPAAATSATDVNNLKLAVAELSNKNRLINELALENQKLHSRLFTIEEKLDAKSQKLAEKDN